MPITVTTLNDFDRADATNPGPNWMQIANVSPPRLWIQDGAAAHPSFLVEEFWLPDTLGPDVEVQLELNSDLSGGAIVELFARLVWPHPETPPEEWNPAFSYAITDGYAARFVTDEVTVGNFALIGSNEFPPVLDPEGGGAVALRCEGNTISALMRVDATSGWETVVSVEDTTWGDEGYAGLGLLTVGSGGATGFSGGEETPAPPVTVREAWGVLAR